ncbi:gastric triacylglycerol lipase-like [Lineus longissimus]|uniref:gastric triacylglycerol lipase-like n=1 Tax=Lineus longissimus TaxID=88925 RepID=UPI002B4DC3C5
MIGDGLRMMLKWMVALVLIGTVAPSALKFMPSSVEDILDYLNLNSADRLGVKEASVSRSIPNISAIITGYGYPIEEYETTTTDGYILAMQRIPHGRQKTDGPKPAVLVVHGLLGLATDFVSNAPNQSLGFILADNGYDVWLGNCRGNTYSRRHVKLKPDQEVFWDFSFDEMALQDLPAFVNKVISVTNESKISYVGYSEGTMMGFAGFSQNQTLANQVKAFYAMGPVTTINHITSPLKILAPFANELGFLFELFGRGEFLPRNALMDWIAKYACDGSLPEVLCTNFLFMICGTDFANLNETRIPFYLDYIPAGTSSRNMIHFAQLINSKKFQMYNYGSKSENEKHYKQDTPPEYHPENVNIPVALFYGDKDKLADKGDVAELIPKLKKLIKAVEIPIFEHLDFIWAMNAVDPVYKPMLDMMKQIEEKTEN